MHCIRITSDNYFITLIVNLLYWWHLPLTRWADIVVKKKILDALNEVGPFTANRFSLYYIGQSNMNSAVPSKPISASKSLTVLTVDFFSVYSKAISLWASHFLLFNDTGFCKWHVMKRSLLLDEKVWHVFGIKKDRSLLLDTVLHIGKGSDNINLSWQKK